MVTVAPIGILEPLRGKSIHACGSLTGVGLVQAAKKQVRMIAIQGENWFFKWIFIL
jgi:hypothetical protein